jgi:hypothetical protein
MALERCRHPGQRALDRQRHSLGALDDQEAVTHDERVVRRRDRTARLDAVTLSRGDLLYARVDGLGSRDVHEIPRRGRHVRDGIELGLRHAEGPPQEVVDVAMLGDQEHGDAREDEAAGGHTPPGPLRDHLMDPGVHASHLEF